jgi:hypothetical protein
MINTTRQQEEAADFAASAYGRSSIVPSHLAEYTGNVVIVGLTDDIERSSWTIRRDGKVANVAWRDSALDGYLKTIPPQRRPMLVPRAAQTGGLAATR